MHIVLVSAAMRFANLNITLFRIILVLVFFATSSKFALADFQCKSYLAYQWLYANRSENSSKALAVRNIFSDLAKIFSKHWKAFKTTPRKLLIFVPAKVEAPKWPGLKRGLRSPFKIIFYPYNKGTYLLITLPTLKSTKRIFGEEYYYTKFLRVPMILLTGITIWVAIDILYFMWLDSYTEDEVKNDSSWDIKIKYNYNFRHILKALKDNKLTIEEARVAAWKWQRKFKDYREYMKEDYFEKSFKENLKWLLETGLFKPVAAALANGIAPNQENYIYRSHFKANLNSKNNSDLEKVKEAMQRIHDYYKDTNEIKVNKDPQDIFAKLLLVFYEDGKPMTHEAIGKPEEYEHSLKRRLQEDEFYLMQLDIEEIFGAIRKFKENGVLLNRPRTIHDIRKETLRELQRIHKNAR